MIQRLSHVSIFVLDQQEAKDFYVNKLGFSVHTEAPMGPDFTWLTVSPPGQPDLEIALMPCKAGMMWDEETAETVRNLVKNGKLGAGVFATADCQKTYDELVEKGVTFKQPPTEQFYGIEAILQDNSGNWFSMTQAK